MLLPYALLSSIIIALISLVGIVVLALKHEFVDKIVYLLVSLATGALLGGAFLHLLPESFEHLPPQTIFRLTLVSFVISFIVEKFLSWHHCHDQKCTVHPIGYMNLVGDGIHNFIDGLVIAGAFVTDINVGIITSIAIALHEIPQEIGDFGVLLHAGIERRRALLLNALAASTVILGTMLGLIIGGASREVAHMLLPIAAGGFIYIAATDLLPELRSVEKPIPSVLSFLVMLIGISFMFLL